MMGTANPKNPSRRLAFLAGLALVGIGLSVALTQHYYEIRSGTAGFRSYCNLSATMNCDVVAASPYAELVAGLPLSSFSAGWYLALLIIALIARGEVWRRDSMRALLAMTAFGSVLSIFYFVIMAMVLKFYCLLCLFVDGINFFLLGIVLSMRGARAGTTDAPLDLSKWKTFAGITAVCLAVALVGLKGLEQPTAADESNVSGQEIVDSVVNSPVIAVHSGPEFPSIGSASAPITIVEFSDFQCPFCRLGAMTLNTVLSRYPDKVRVVFRNFPLDSSCNRMLQQPKHDSACEAARTALCANKQSKFKPVYEALFENQTSIRPGKPPEIARNAGADQASLTSCLSSPDIGSALSRDIEEAIQLNIQSTPTFFVNGRKIEGVYPPPIWNKLIDRLLQHP